MAGTTPKIIQHSTVSNGKNATTLSNLGTTNPLPSSPASKPAPLPTTVNDAIRGSNSSIDPKAVLHKDGYIYPNGYPVNGKDNLQQQCVALVGAIRPDVGTNTSKWSKGDDLTKQNGNYPPLKEGTPIATFKNGTYPGDTGIMDPSRSGPQKYAHSAIFLSYTYNKDGSVKGMKVLEQYEGQRAQIGERNFPTRYTYSVVE